MVDEGLFLFVLADMDRLHLATAQTYTAAFAFPGTDLGLHVHVHGKFAAFRRKPHGKLLDRTAEPGKTVSFEVRHHKDLLQFRQPPGDRTGFEVLKVYRHIERVFPFFAICDHHRDPGKAVLLCQFQMFFPHKPLAAVKHAGFHKLRGNTFFFQQIDHAIIGLRLEIGFVSLFPEMHFQRHKTLQFNTFRLNHLFEKLTRRLAVAMSTF